MPNSPPLLVHRSLQTSTLAGAARTGARGLGARPPRPPRRRAGAPSPDVGSYIRASPAVALEDAQRALRPLQLCLDPPPPCTWTLRLRRRLDPPPPEWIRRFRWPGSPPCAPPAAAAGEDSSPLSVSLGAGEREDGERSFFFFSRRGLEGWGSGKIVVISAKFRGNCGRKGDGQLPEPRGASFHWLHVACGSRRWL